MNKEKARVKEITRLFESLELELDELESAYNLQFDLPADLHEKLQASKRAREALKKARQLRNLIAQSLGRLKE